ncbi:MAG: peptide-methionine (R)-S-oxide reductase [Arsenophonus sp. NEOnobi-MAG3]
MKVCCRYCNTHLGHVFADLQEPTWQHYCINSIALSFTDQES